MTTQERGALGYPGTCDFIDLSSCQGHIIDWPAVLAAGFIAVVVKVSEGATGVDPEAIQNLEGAEEAGLYTLVYHFARVTQDADAQAENMWRRSGDKVRVPVLDAESAPDGMPALAIAHAILREADAIEHRFGRPPLLYSGESFLRERVGPALAADAELLAAFARMPCWIAHYGSVTVPMVPAPGYRPKVPPGMRLVALQYSGNGGFRVPGIPVDCDRNLFFGDLADFRRELGLPDSGSDPTLKVLHPSVMDLDDPPDDVA
jgi:GH25 family lysozyme M1 (1,4-beta-N-acetylmuramidase)